MKTPHNCSPVHRPCLSAAHASRLLLLILGTTLCLLIGQADAQNFAPAATKLHGRATTPQAGNLFGQAVAVSDALLLVGEFSNNDVASNAGAAHLYDARTGRYLRKLTADDGATNDHFGDRVALCGNFALIGAPNGDHNGVESGSAYVFDVRTGRQLAKLTASDGATNDNFGFSLALSGNFALIGAFGDGDNGTESGSAYVFDVRTGEQLIKLVPSDGAVNDKFGWSVALSGNLALIGAPYDDENGVLSGSAYVFDVRTGAQLTKLTATDGEAGDLFGRTMALDGNLALIGAVGDDDNGGSSGSAYVFDVITGLQLTKLTAEDGATNGGFSSGVALNGNLALIGASGDVSSRGAVYVYDLRDGRQLTKLTANDGATFDQFGTSVALSGNRALIGARLDDDLGIDSGSVYYYREISGPLPMEILSQTRNFAPGAVEADFRSFGDAVINSEGEAAFYANLMGRGAGRGTAAKGVWSDLAADSLNLITRGGSDLGGGLTQNVTGRPIFNRPGDLVFPGTLRGTGVNRSNDGAIFRSNEGGVPTVVLREGDVPTASGAAFSRFLDVSQSFTGVNGDLAVAFQYRNGPGGVNRSSDTGVLAANYNGSIDGTMMNEGDELISMAGTFWGQFAPRIAKPGQYMAWAAFLQGTGVTTANNQGLFGYAPGAGNEIPLHRKGDSAGGGTISTFQGEVVNPSLYVLYRAILNGVPRSQNEILTDGSNINWQKGDEPHDLDPTFPAGVKTVRLLKFWSLNSNRVIYLAKLAGPGVNPSNDCGLFLWDASTLQPLMREGDDVGSAADCPKIGRILRVDAEPITGQYVVLTSLTGNRAANQAIFTGDSFAGNNTDKQALRLPTLQLRKGTTYQAPTSETTRLLSLTFSNTTDRAGIGAKGGPQVIDANGNVVMCLQFTNRAKVLVKGKP